MKLLFLASYDILRPRTNQLSDIRFCEGFVDNGVDVHFCCPYVYRKVNIPRNRVFDFYGINKRFNVTIYPTPFVELGNFIFSPSLFLIIIHFITFFKHAFYSNDKSSKIVVMSRKSSFLILPLLLKKIFNKQEINIIMWAHEVDNKFWSKYVYEKVSYIFATNSKIIQDIHKTYKINENKGIVTYNPVSTWQVEFNKSKHECRKIINYNSDKPLIVYTGKLYINQREIKYILDAAKKLVDYNFLFTGGKKEVIDYYRGFCKKNKMKNVIFTGFLDDYKKIIYYQKAADVLLSYYTKQDHLTEYNYPQKITEYMLTGNVIVTPEYPATSDILNESNCIFVDPENLNSLIQSILIAVNDAKKAGKLARQARKDAEELTFNKVCRKILHIIDAD